MATFTAYVVLVDINGEPARGVKVDFLDITTFTPASPHAQTHIVGTATSGESGEASLGSLDDSHRYFARARRRDVRVIPVLPAGIGGSGAPADATYLVASAHAGLSAEIPVGATPGGELYNTWAIPKVDTTHAGSPHSDYLAKAAFTPAQTVMIAVLDETPLPTEIAEQRLVGRLTGGNLGAVVVGIADNNIVQMDDADAANDDYAKFTAAGLEGRSYAEVRSDINVANGADVTGDNAPQAHKDSHDPNDGSDALDTANAASIAGVQAAGTGTSHSLARADHAHGIAHSIADNALATVDDADAADNDYAKFTASGLEGRSYAEVKADLDLEIGTDVLAQQAIGIADDNLVEVDGTPNDDEYARFTANGLEGRTAAEAKTDLGFISDVVDDATPQLGGALDGQGEDLNNLGVVFLTEQAAAEADVAGKGQVWVKTATPNELWFTDDAGTDHQLGVGGGGGTCSALFASALVPGVLGLGTEVPQVPAAYTGTATELYLRYTGGSADVVTATIYHCEEDGTAIGNQAVAMAGAVFKSQAISWSVDQNDYFYIVIDDLLNSDAADLVWQVRP